MKGETKAVFDACRNDLIRLHANWSIFKQLFASEDDRYRVFNETAPGFFRLIQDVLVDDAVISLSRLTDQADCQSLLRLVKLLKSHVSPSLHKELAADLAALQAATADVRGHRDKRVAHRARPSPEPTVSGQAVKLPPLTRKKIEGAMALCAALLNKVLGHFENTEQLFTPVIRGDADSLFHFLHRAYLASEHERADALARFAAPKSA